MRWVRRASLWVRQRPLLSRIALAVFPDFPITVNVDGLGPFRVRLRRNRAFWLRNPRDFERFQFTILRQLVRPGDVVYDLGANLGLYTRFLLRELRAGHVVAFEPWEENRRWFLENVRLGGIADRVTLLPFAIADFDGDATFQVDDIQSTSGTLDAARPGTPSVGRSNIGLAPRTTTVASRRLDGLLETGQLPLPRVLKIDIEGAEALALVGASHLLAAHGPHLLVELHGAEVAREVLRFLLAAGYHCAGLVQPQLHPEGYGLLTEATMDRIKGLYDVQFLVATRAAADLPVSYLDLSSPDA